jgi:coenzyme F420-reducing hydrogenase delta subunit
MAAAFAATVVGAGCHAKQAHHAAALAIVGLPYAECRYRSGALSKNAAMTLEHETE